MTSPTDKIPEDVMRAVADFCRARGLSPMDIPFHPTAAVLAVIDAIMAERAADKWQPIETAPKDGTIIVWSPMYGGKVFFAKWDDNQYARKPRPYWSFSDERLWGTIRVRDHQPTHWMPLPPPPAIRGES